MSIIITLEGADWAEIVSQARQIIGEPAEAPKPRATRTKAAAPADLAPAGAGGLVPPTDPSPRGGAGGALPPNVVYEINMALRGEEPAPEPVFESTVTTPIVEEHVPSVDAPVETQASTSEAGSDEPASGSATTASEPITYEDMSREVLALAKEKGPDAVKAVLSTLGLTTARGTPEDMWPQIVAAVRSAM
ncbi:MAG: hypothetical protein IOC86_04185 [Aestuariivirga sp.]|nr:hypothetical protein [Aestuariivirga sp.]